MVGRRRGCRCGEGGGVAVRGEDFELGAGEEVGCCGVRGRVMTRASRSWERKVWREDLDVPLNQEVGMVPMVGGGMLWLVDRRC